MEVSLQNFMNNVKIYCQKLYEKNILHSVYLRGSISRNEFNNNISDIDIVFIYTNISYKNQVINTLNNLLSEEFLDLYLDLIHISLYDILTYNTLFFLKYKSTLFVGNSNLIEHIKNDTSITDTNIPCLNFIKIVSYIDTILYPISPNTIVSIQTKHRLVSVLKKCIRAVFEYFFYTKKIFIYNSCLKKQSEQIISLSNLTETEELLKNKVVYFSSLIEYFMLNNFYKEFKNYKNELYINLNEFVNILKTDYFTNIRFEYEKEYSRLPMLSIDRFIT
jgi:hypothetical protein